MKIWVLIDNKVGSSKQSLALAKILGQKFSIKKISYTLLAKIPNCLPNVSKYTITKKTRLKLTRLTAPDVIIGAGRKLARVLIYLKTLYPGVQLVQILKPQIPLKHFNAVIIPHHDTIRYASKADLKKVIRIDGAIVWHDPVEMKQIKTAWQPQFLHLLKYRIALLIGGNSKNCKIQHKHALDLANKTIEIAKANGASLLVTNSRRTPLETSRIIFGSIRKSGVKAVFYDANSNILENPYKAYLACADAIIVTGDSISMCAEAIATGKPVLVYGPKGMIGNKHWKFINHLLENNRISLLAEANLNLKIDQIQCQIELKDKLLSILDTND